MVVESAVERSYEVTVFAAHRAVGQSGEPLRITFPADQRVDHVSDRHRGDLRGDRGDLDQGVFEELLEALIMPGPPTSAVTASTAKTLLPRFAIRQETGASASDPAETSLPAKGIKRSRDESVTRDRDTLTNRGWDHTRNRMSDGMARFSRGTA